MDDGTQPRAVVIVFMGDSITAGQFVEPAQRWTSLVGDALTRVLGSHHASVPNSISCRPLPLGTMG